MKEEMMKSKHGFTLIELLVVIAIIALLVSILLPSLNRAKEMARRAVCMTRLNGIGKGMQLYAGEASGELPRPSVSDPNGGVWLRAGYRGSRAASDATEAIDAIFNKDTSSSVKVSGDPTAGLFIMIRGGMLSAKGLLCPSDEEGIVDPLDDGDIDLLVDIESMKNCSFSTQYMWGDNVNWSLSGPGSLVIAADLSPVGITGADVTQDDETGNSFNHAQEGQNVLTISGAVSWDSTNRMGIGGDNIYTSRNSSDAKEDGTAPGVANYGGSDSLPYDEEDSVMIFYDRNR